MSESTMPNVSADEETTKHVFKKENSKPAVSRRDLSYKPENRKMSEGDVISP